ncbi:unnamed protein product [Mytilus edulis]|uniref:DZIP3-like HEPN domain-containing protein n=1 Tax=Mytilus edulis TaxID=6550 RepID=A0A8S3SGF2_MYTED|nr:unnamed protein product [Mytilus edulis]
MAVVFDVSDILPNSKTFDVTLMICLIRNLTSINPPINGFDSLPLPGETTPGSDLARIKWYRNVLGHHDSTTIDIAYFNTAWRDISDAVGRLGGQAMYHQCQEIKEVNLDRLRMELLDITNQLGPCPVLYDELMASFLAEQVEVRKGLKDPIQPNIRGILCLLIQ